MYNIQKTIIIVITSVPIVSSNIYYIYINNLF